MCVCVFVFLFFVVLLYPKFDFGMVAKSAERHKVYCDRFGFPIWLQKSSWLSSLGPFAKISVAWGRVLASSDST